MAAYSQFQSRLITLQGNLYNFALVLTSNRDDAHDLLQDTTLKALDNESSYVETSNFKSWVFTIMRNIFINNYRRAQHATRLVETTDDLFRFTLIEAGGADCPDSSFSAAEIETAINDFDPKYGSPFKMHIAGYRYDEIADKMQMPLGTIKSRIFTARQALQRLFSD